MNKKNKKCLTCKAETYGQLCKKCYINKGTKRKNQLSRMKKELSKFNTTEGGNKK